MKKHFCLFRACTVLLNDKNDLIIYDNNYICFVMKHFDFGEKNENNYFFSLNIHS